MKHLKFSFSIMSITISIMSIFILACGNATTSKEDKKISNLNNKSCLVKYANSPCKILSTEKVLELTGIEVAIDKAKEPVTNKVAGRLECTYIWDSGRTKKTKTAIGNIDSKVNDIISIGHFRIYDRNKTKMTAEDWFKNSFPILTKKEIALREARYNEKLASGEKNAVEGMIIRTYKKLDRKRINNIGDRALQDIHENLTVATVIVMHKNTVFQVSADISIEVEKNIELAKKIAKVIIESCN